MEQELPTASDAGQLFVSVNPASPFFTIDEILSDELPEFDNRTICAELVVPSGCAANVSDVGERDATGAVPVPVREMLCVLPATPPESSVSTTLPLATPVWVGRKVTVTVQEVPTGSDAPQLLFCVKVPLLVIEEMFSVELPVFDSTIPWAALVVSRSCPAKVSELGDREATGATPAPLRLTAPPAPAGDPFVISVAEIGPVVAGAKTTLIVQ
jgi:hypothetical protein